MCKHLLPVLGLVLVGHASADVSVVGIPNTRWGFTGSSVGVAGLTIESFEDTKLEAGMQVRWTAPAGSFGPTAVLPNLFDPVTDDPFGNVFETGVWDGTHVLINTRTNRPFPYPESANWGDLELLFDPPVRTLAFSVQQMDLNNRLVINGVDLGGVRTVTGLPTGGGRMGYIVINATGDDTISSMLVDNVGGDGFVLDYVAFTVEEAPSVRMSIVPPGQWGAPDGGLGFATATFEDFEDVALVEGLQIEWETPLGNTPAGGMLPGVFDPVMDDSFGNAFDQSVWDGTHVVLNTRDNQSHPYAELGNWGDIIFHLGPPMSHVGFAAGDIQRTPLLVVNGRMVGAVSGLDAGARQGFLRFAARPPGIASLRLMNSRIPSSNDGIAIDHLGFMECPVDVNSDTLVNSQDLFDYLGLFFANDPAADFNLDDRVNSQDFFDFLSAFFLGC